MIRRLAWAACSFSAAVFLAHFLVLEPYWLWCAAGCALLCLPGLLLKGKNRQRALLLCGFLALGFVRYWGQMAFVISPAEAFAGETRVITARVTDYPVVNDGYTTVYVRLMDETLPDRKAMFYSYDGVCDDLRPGDIITSEARLRSALTRMGEETDTYISKGISLRGYFQGEMNCNGRWWASFLYMPKEAAHVLRETCERLFPPRTAMFLKALTTGEKSDIYLDPEVYVSLSVAGIMHVVAVSGMHVMLLLSVVSMVLGNRKGIIAGVAAIVFFGIMTGGSPSVTRAVLMQVVYLLAPLLRREADGITTLSAALCVLLLADPCAAGSISLQLSFASMAGLILLTPKIYDWLSGRFKPGNGMAGRIQRGLLLSVSATVGATVFSTPISALHFGYVSLYGALTNIVTMYTVPLCFIGGFAGCILGLFVPAMGQLAGVLLSVPVELTYMAAGAVSKLPYAAVYLSGNGMGWWLLGVYALFALTYLLKGKRPYRPLFPTAAAVVSLCLLMGGLTARYREGTTVTAVDVGQGQSIVFLDGDTTMVVDCGGDFNGAAGDRTGAYLLGRGRQEIDLLVLTHLHRDHVNGVTRLMARVPVKHLILREKAEDEDRALEEILYYAERQGTEVTFLEETAQWILDEFDLVLYLSPYKGENQGIIVQASVESYDVLVLGDVNHTADKWLVREFGLPDGELIVAGHHGAKSSTGEVLLDAFTPETALISVGYNNYGHPTQEVLDRFARRGIAVRRTDREGNLEIRIGEHGEEGNS